MNPVASRASIRHSQQNKQHMTALYMTRDREINSSQVLELYCLVSGSHRLVEMHHAITKLGKIKVLELAPLKDSHIR